MAAFHVMNFNGVGVCAVRGLELLDTALYFIAMTNGTRVLRTRGPLTRMCTSFTVLLERYIEGGCSLLCSWTLLKYNFVSTKGHIFGSFFLFILVIFSVIYIFSASLYKFYYFKRVLDS